MELGELAGGMDVFFPIWQTRNKLLFTDLRFYDRTGGIFEGNAHVGYRYLSPDEQWMIGIYGAFDRRRSGLGNYFNQLTLGGELWVDNWFVGGNVYKPMGETSRFMGVIDEQMQIKNNGVYKNIWFVGDHQSEQALGGFDCEVGYEFTRGVVGYVGGYYFDAKDASIVTGPKARLTYDLFLDNGKKVLGVFNKVGLEIGIQRDKTRGVVWYLGINARFGLAENNNKSTLEGVSRHMVDPVRRDIDIVATDERKRRENPLVTPNGTVKNLLIIEDMEGIDNMIAQPSLRKGADEIILSSKIKKGDRKTVKQLKKVFTQLSQKGAEKKDRKLAKQFIKILSNIKTSPIIQSPTTKQFYQLGASFSGSEAQQSFPSTSKEEGKIKLTRFVKKLMGKNKSFSMSDVLCKFQKKPSMASADNQGKEQQRYSQNIQNDSQRQVLPTSNQHLETNSLKKTEESWISQGNQESKKENSSEQNSSIPNTLSLTIPTSKAEKSNISEGSKDESLTSGTTSQTPVILATNTIADQNTISQTLPTSNQQPNLETNSLTNSTEVNSGSQDQTQESEIIVQKNSLTEAIGSNGSDGDLNKQKQSIDDKPSQQNDKLQLQQISQNLNSEKISSQTQLQSQPSMKKRQEQKRIEEANKKRTEKKKELQEESKKESKKKCRRNEKE
jgi:hypothetical protein